MDAVFQRHDIRDGGAKKVTYVDDVPAALRHSGEGRNPGLDISGKGLTTWSCAPKVHNTIARGNAPGKCDG